MFCVRRSTGDALLAVAETAALARDAWALAHAWDLADGVPGALAGDDATAFAAWAREYGARTGREHFTDRARLAGVVADVLEEPRVRKPPLLVAYAFDAVAPQGRRSRSARRPRRGDRALRPAPRGEGHPRRVR
jgi:pimeloyl-ACP methyl ester carboxylesterase